MISVTAKWSPTLDRPRAVYRPSVRTCAGLWSRYMIATARWSKPWRWCSRTNADLAGKNVADCQSDVEQAVYLCIWPAGLPARLGAYHSSLMGWGVGVLLKTEFFFRAFSKQNNFFSSLPCKSLFPSRRESHYFVSWEIKVRKFISTKLLLPCRFGDVEWSARVECEESRGVLLESGCKVVNLIQIPSLCRESRGILVTSAWFIQLTNSTHTRTHTRAHRWSEKVTVQSQPITRRLNYSQSISERGTRVVLYPDWTTISIPISVEIA